MDGDLKSVTKKIRFFDRSDEAYPTADFISPQSDVDVKAKTDIIGTVKDETGLAYYTLEYKLNGTDDYKEIDGYIQYLPELKIHPLNMYNIIKRVNAEGNTKISEKAGIHKKCC